MSDERETMNFFNMKKNVKYLSLILSATILNFSAIAQDTVDMADTMRSNGKIYVVVTVCLVILIGLFIYVARIDGKVRKLEKELKN